jgi:cyclopropane fatty-acyl-phospholipid synthase-like methyltransferase
VILDIGTGIGVPAVWLLERFTQARVYGIEPDRRRVLFASRAMNGKGTVTVGFAPAIPVAPQKADTVTMLDMLHYLSDETLALTLQKLREAMTSDGRLIIRATVPTMTQYPWKTRIKALCLKVLHISFHYRQLQEIENALKIAGFHVISTEPSVPWQEKQWIIAEVS